MCGNVPAISFVDAVHGGGGNRTRVVVPAERGDYTDYAYGQQPRYLIVRALQERDGNQCFYCDNELSPYRTHIDHVVPTVNRGSDALDNLVLACQRCNIVKRQQPGWFFVFEESRRWRWRLRERNAA